VQIGGGVVAVVLKTERLAPTVVVTLCQCHVMDVNTHILSDEKSFVYNEDHFEYNSELK
jgi:hypothetical protein